MKTMNKHIAITTLAAALALAACADTENVDTTVTATPPTVDPAAATIDPTMDPALTAGTAPGDLAAMGEVNPTAQERELLGVLMVINDHQVAVANQATARDIEGEAADFARHMIEEHTRNREMVAAMNPDTNAAMAMEQRQTGQAHLEQLDELQGDAYRRAYIEAMVRDHQQALQILDDQAIPAATTPAVQAHLRQTRESVAAHLEQAQQLLTQMGSAAS